MRSQVIDLELNQDLKIAEVEVNFFGDYANFDHAVLSVNLNTSFQFVGNADEETTYWVGNMIDFDQQSMSFIEGPSYFDTANTTYFYEFQTESWINGNDPMWPIGGYEHAMISLYGDCETFAITYLTQNKFKYVIHDNQLQVVHFDLINELIVQVSS